MYPKYFKRIFDLVLSLTALIVLSPIMICVAAAIVVGDPGPIIFRQLRVGKGGKDFVFFKFRSMPVNTGDIPSGELGAITISAVGKFIRRTNLDELPQLFNILLGEMSIVGPRPSLPSQRELIDVRLGNSALSCRPGLTGLAQVNSYNGMTWEKKASWDGIYASKVTFSGDFSIILKTFSYVMRPPPVY